MRKKIALCLVLFSVAVPFQAAQAQETESQFISIEISPMSSNIVVSNTLVLSKTSCNIKYNLNGCISKVSMKATLEKKNGSSWQSVSNTETLSYTNTYGMTVGVPVSSTLSSGEYRVKTLINGETIYSDSENIN